MAMWTSCRSCTTSTGASVPEELSSEQLVTPWSVVAKGPRGIDYERVLTTFQSSVVDAQLVERFARVAQKLIDGRSGSSSLSSSPSLELVHPLIRRHVAFSHRDLHLILDDAENGRPFYLYTGRGPSASTMHIGHIVPFLLTKYLQDTFGCPLVIQVTDDEKFLFRDMPLGTKAGEELVRSNIKDIIAFGFDPKLTFIFRNTEYMGPMYKTVLEVQRLLTYNAMKNTFGFGDSDNIGRIAFPAIQAAPCFSTAFPKVLAGAHSKMKCLIPCAIDQDPFFIVTRSVCERLKRPKPALLHTKFVPALKGATSKMSSSAEQNGVVLLTDNLDTVRRKLRRAFSGGSGTLDELRANGPDLAADVAFQLLCFFEPSDGALEDVRCRYQSGAVHSGDVKDIAADVLFTHALRGWQERRRGVSDPDVDAFCSVRNILRPT
jgi:tryptophanyl-tRNA synthetase